MAFINTEQFDRDAYPDLPLYREDYLEWLRAGDVPAGERLQVQSQRYVETIERMQRVATRTDRSYACIATLVKLIERISEAGGEWMHDRASRELPGYYPPLDHVETTDDIQFDDLLEILRGVDSTLFDCEALRIEGMSELMTLQPNDTQMSTATNWLYAWSTRDQQMRRASGYIDSIALNEAFGVASTFVYLRDMADFARRDIADDDMLLSAHASDVISHFPHLYEVLQSARVIHEPEITGHEEKLAAIKGLLYSARHELNRGAAAVQRFNTLSELLPEDRRRAMSILTREWFITQREALGEVEGRLLEESANLTLEDFQAMFDDCMRGITVGAMAVQTCELKSFQIGQRLMDPMGTPEDVENLQLLLQASTDPAAMRTALAADPCWRSVLKELDGELPPPPETLDATLVPFAHRAPWFGADAGTSDVAAKLQQARETLGAIDTDAAAASDLSLLVGHMAIKDGQLRRFLVEQLPTSGLSAATVELWRAHLEAIVEQLGAGVLIEDLAHLQLQHEAHLPQFGIQVDLDDGVAVRAMRLAQLEIDGLSEAADLAAAFGDTEQLTLLGAEATDLSRRIGTDVVEANRRFLDDLATISEHHELPAARMAQLISSQSLVNDSDGSPSVLWPRLEGSRFRSYVALHALNLGVQGNDERIAVETLRERLELPQALEQLYDYARGSQSLDPPMVTAVRQRIGDLPELAEVVGDGEPEVDHPDAPESPKTVRVDPDRPSSKQPNLDRLDGPLSPPQSDASRDHPEGPTDGPSFPPPTLPFH